MSGFALGIYEGHKSENEAVEEFTKAAEAIADLEEKAKNRLDRAFELLALEEQGRLYITPCELGQMVFRFQRYFNDATLQSEVKIKPCRIESIYLGCVMADDHVLMSFSDFGKTVFLTREEAEQALKGGAN